MSNNQLMKMSACEGIILGNDWQFDALFLYLNILSSLLNAIINLTLCFWPAFQQLTIFQIDTPYTHNFL